MRLKEVLLWNLFPLICITQFHLSLYPPVLSVHSPSAVEHDQYFSEGQFHFQFQFIPSVYLMGVKLKAGRRILKNYRKKYIALL